MCLGFPDRATQDASFYFCHSNCHIQFALCAFILVFFYFKLSWDTGHQKRNTFCLPDKRCSFLTKSTLLGGRNQLRRWNLPRRWNPLHTADGWISFHLWKVTPHRSGHPSRLSDFQSFRALLFDFLIAPLILGRTLFAWCVDNFILFEYTNIRDTVFREKPTRPLNTVNSAGGISYFIC